MPASREPEAAPSRTSGRVACCWARARGGSPRGRNLPGVLTTKGAPLFQSKRTDSEGLTLSALGFSPGSPSASSKRGARSEFSVSEQRKAQRRGLARARRRRSRTPRRWGQGRGSRVWCGGPGGGAPLQEICTRAPRHACRRGGDGMSPATEDTCSRRAPWTDQLASPGLWLPQTAQRAPGSRSNREGKVSLSVSGIAGGQSRRTSSLLSYRLLMSPSLGAK